MGQCGSAREESEDDHGDMPKKFPYPAVDDHLEIEYQPQQQDEVPTRVDETLVQGPVQEEVVKQDQVTGDGVERIQNEFLNLEFPEAMLMLESGAERVFGWVRVDMEGNETMLEEMENDDDDDDDDDNNNNDEEDGVSGHNKSKKKHKNVKKKTKKKKKKKNTKSTKERLERFERYSTILCPGIFTWEAPLHYICYYVFPGVSPDKIFDALYDMNCRAKWESSWGEARRLESVTKDCDVLYTCFLNENRILRMMGMNFDFVDKRRVLRHVTFPQKHRFAGAYKVAWNASRQSSEPIDRALKDNAFRLASPRRVSRKSTMEVDDQKETDGSGGNDENHKPRKDVIYADFGNKAKKKTIEQPWKDECIHTTGSLKFQRVQPLPPAEFVVALSPEEDNFKRVEKRSNFSRCQSMPPSGFIIRSFDAQQSDPATCYFTATPENDGKINKEASFGTRLCIVSRSSITLPINGGISRKRLHVTTLDSFVQWRKQLEGYLYGI